MCLTRLIGHRIGSNSHSVVSEEITNNTCMHQSRCFSPVFSVCSSSRCSSASFSRVSTETSRPETTTNKTSCWGSRHWALIRLDYLPRSTRSWFLSADVFSFSSSDFSRLCRAETTDSPSHPPAVNHTLMCFCYSGSCSRCYFNENW